MLDASDIDYDGLDDADDVDPAIRMHEASLAAEVLGLGTHPTFATDFTYGLPTPVIESDHCFLGNLQAPHMQHTVSAPATFAGPHYSALAYDLGGAMYAENTRFSQ